MPIAGQTLLGFMKCVLSRVYRESQGGTLALFFLYLGAESRFGPDRDRRAGGASLDYSSSRLILRWQGSSSFALLVVVSTGRVLWHPGLRSLHVRFTAAKYGYFFLPKWAPFAATPCLGPCGWDKLTVACQGSTLWRLHLVAVSTE